jgi:Rod binding domain-containing protein
MEWKSLDILPTDLRLVETEERAKVRDTAKDFAGFFYAQLIASQRQTIDKNEMFHGGQGEEMFTRMLDQEYAQSMSRTGGLTDMVESTLARRMHGYATTEARNLAIAGPIAAKAYGATQ